VTSPANQYINLSDGKTISSLGINAGMDGKASNKEYQPSQFVPQCRNPLNCITAAACVAPF
jgi:hypothetical protein